MSHATESETIDLAELHARLAEPFDPSEVKWKAQTVKGERCLAVAYIDARLVMDRLDSVLGVGRWRTRYRDLVQGAVCTLEARIGDEWVTHEDVGSFSKQPDEGDKVKAAYSDALKRAAVRFGIGRYLYGLPKCWVNYDSKSRQVAETPSLPAWALPRPSGMAKPTPSSAHAETESVDRLAPPTSQAQQDAPKLAKPTSGKELHERLTAADKDFVRRGVSKHLGDLWVYMMGKAMQAGLPPEYIKWTEEQVAQAYDIAKQYKGPIADLPAEHQPRGTPKKATATKLRAITALAGKLDMEAEGVLDLARTHNLLGEREILTEMNADAAQDLERMLQRRVDEQVANDALPTSWTQPVTTYASAEGR